MLLAKLNVLKNYAKPSLASAIVLMAAPVNAASTDAAPDFVNMMTSLVIVIGLIFALAMVAKRFNIGNGGQGVIKLIATLPVGTKERLIIVEIEQQQYLLGVTTQQVRLIERLDKKIESPAPSAQLPDGITLNSVIKFMKKGSS